MTAITAALVQHRGAALDPAANAVRSAAVIAEHAARGAGLVILPELYSTGYVPDREQLLPLAERVGTPGPCLQAWSAAARESRTVVVAGFAERVGDSLYNSAAVFDADGGLRQVYRKLHLFGAEHEAFSPGDNGLPVVDVGGVRIGVLICYDLRFPEAMRILALRGAEVIVVPTSWTAGFDGPVPADAPIGQVTGAGVQANLNQVFVLCADQVGSVGDVQLLGRSVAFDPYGTAIAGPLSSTDEDVALVHVETAEVARARHRGAGIDPFENRRTDVYDHLLGYREADAARHGREDS